MKKGFTMIELIFVIVILGILASVAIPRLASTRTDAEISSAIANLRTLTSDVGAYYTTTGSIADKWKTMTNVNVGNEFSQPGYGLYGELKIGGDSRCIDITAVAGTNTSNDPAAIMLNTNTATTDAVCKAVLDAKEVQEFTKHEIFTNCTESAQGNDGCVGGKQSLGYGILIGSSAKVYE